MSRSRDLANLANNATGLETLTVSDITDLTASATELNKLDGFTGVVADLNYAKDLNATGVTSTEFDFLDGVSANITTSTARASGYPLGQYEITDTAIGSSGWTQLTLDDGSAGVKYEYGGVDLANSNNDITVPSTGMYEIKVNVFFRDADSARYIFLKCKKHTTDISAETTGTEIFNNGTNNPDIGGAYGTDHVLNASFYYSLSANDHISWWSHAVNDQTLGESAIDNTYLSSFIAIRKIFDL